MQTIEAEQGQNLCPSLLRHPQTLQHSELIFLIGHPKGRTKAALLGKVPQHFEAESMQGPSSDVLRGIAPRFLEPHGDLFSRLVGEGDGQDSPGWNPELLDEMLDPTDQTVGLSGTRPGHDQHRTERGLDGTALLEGGLEAHACTAFPLSARAQPAIVSANSSMTWS